MDNREHIAILSQAATQYKFGRIGSRENKKPPNLGNPDLLYGRGIMMPWRFEPVPSKYTEKKRFNGLTVEEVMAPYGIVTIPKKQNR